MQTTYTTEQLEAKTTEELQVIVTDLGLFANSDRQFLITSILLAQQFPDYIEQVKRQRKAS